MSEEPVKAKRGRKSKKELLAALKMEPSVDSASTTATATATSTTTATTATATTAASTTVSTTASTASTTAAVTNINLQVEEKTDDESEKDKEPKVAKKRGRKPKGGKIVQQISTTLSDTTVLPNVILHLKCSLKDLATNQSTSFDSYNKNDLSYEIVGSDAISSVNVYNPDVKPLLKQTTNTVVGTCTTSVYDDDNEDDDVVVCKDATKELWKKLKHLEHNLHVNNVNNKRSACFWDTCEFDSPPIYIPKHCINDTYHVYGCFCSPECGVAYLMNENIDSSTKFERYHLFNNIYGKIHDYKKNIKPAPNPYYMLEKFCGNLSIQEYRALLRNERLFLIVDKPLTRIMPELHEDNDEFLLNTTIIPSNNLKSRLQRKKQTKNSILNEKFGQTVSTSS